MAAWKQYSLVPVFAMIVVFLSSFAALAQNGVLSLRIEGQGPDGASYRLRDALFVVRGSDIGHVISTEADSDTEVLSLELRGGSYSIELMPGWRVERGFDDQISDVAARLTADNPQSFVVTPAQLTEVTYTFEVNNLQTGELRLAMEIEFAPITTPSKPDLCDPIAQSGCMAGEKCTAVMAQDGIFRTTCVASGERTEGEACERNADSGSDDCAAGLFCLSGRCERVCNRTSVVPGCNCTAFSGLFEDRENVGVCQPSCDILQQNCPAGQSCYINPTSRTQFCAAPIPEAGEQGDDCTFANGCNEGNNCILPNQESTGLQCAFACNAQGGSPSCSDPGGPGPSFTCVRMNVFFSDLGELEDRFGLCVDCSRFPENPACGGD